MLTQIATRRPNGKPTGQKLIHPDRVRFDRRGIPWGAFDWITGERVTFLPDDAPLPL